MSANTRTLLLAPFDKSLVPYCGFFSFLCIWDVAHLNCHPLLPIFNHFYQFSIPHIELLVCGDTILGCLLQTYSILRFGGNVSAPGARRASFLTRALPVDCCR